MGTDEDQADAVMDPWCLVPLGEGIDVLFGFAARHPSTGGLSWVASTAVEELDADRGRARTRSGRRYRLGRRIRLEDVPCEGDEPWIAFELLLGRDVADEDAMPPRVADPGADREWLAACKAARHLGVAPPRRIPAEVTAWLRQHRAAYLRRRREGDRRLI